jgi:hypothetical protein
MAPEYSRTAEEMTPEERAALARKFKEQFKPAAEKWVNAYERRVPFNLEDLTLDKFRHRLGRGNNFYLYSFVMEGTTLTLQESTGQVKVFYLMASKGARELNQPPQSGVMPSLKAPVSMEDVIRMVKADSGVEFKPNEVQIRPTGAASAMNGGAFVHIIPAGANPNNGLSSKVDLVFGPDGNLVNYQRPILLGRRPAGLTWSEKAPLIPERL